MNTKVCLDKIRSDFLPSPVPYAVVTPEGEGPFPLCIVLHGGGGSRESLVTCVPIFEKWWSEETIPKMILASPSAGMSYYLEDAASATCWDTFIVKPLLNHLRATTNVRTDRQSTVITGMSMGGYGALKV